MLLTLLFFSLIEDSVSHPGILLLLLLHLPDNQWIFSFFSFFFTALVSRHNMFAFLQT